MSVTNLPIWKINSTPIEKLREVLQYAESHPEDVNCLMVLWIDSDAISQYQTCATTTISDAVYMLEKTKLEVLSK